MKQVLLSLAIAVLSLPSFADNVHLGYPAYNGTGCPNGTASVALSPDATSLSILFNQFMVEAGGNTGRTVDRKNCDIAVPVHVPQGLSVSVINIDYRGFNSLPAGAMSQFNASYFFAGTTGPSYSKTFSGAQNENYILRNNLIATAMVWSPCGADVNLRAATSMFVRSTGADAFSTVDSADLHAGLIYSLQWRRC
ncbi:MAG: DUF4360 domain-containing protein [Myxococcaceae bacterium]